MTAFHVRALPDLFRLQENDFLRLDGFAAQSAKNLFREIQSARTVPDWQLLASLNIKGIGPNIAKSILRIHTLGELRSLAPDELAGIDGIGPERAGALRSEFDARNNALDELLACITVTATKSGDGDGGSHPTVCFTGQMPEKRSRYEELARQSGYEPVDSVTANLSLLVAADPDETSSKLKKAAKLGIRVLSLERWLDAPGTAGNRTPDSPDRKEPEPESDDLFKLGY